MLVASLFFSCSLARKTKSADQACFFSIEGRSYMHIDYVKSYFEYGTTGESSNVLCNGAFNIRKGTFTLYDTQHLRYTFNNSNDDSLKHPSTNFSFKFCDSIEIASLNGDTLRFQKTKFVKHS
jgi:hypothetical protein